MIKLIIIRDRCRGGGRPEAVQVHRHGGLERHQDGPARLVRRGMQLYVYIYIYTYIYMGRGSSRHLVFLHTTYFIVHKILRAHKRPEFSVV